MCSCEKDNDQRIRCYTMWPSIKIAQGMGHGATANLAWIRADRVAHQSENKTVTNIHGKKKVYSL